MLKKLLVAAIAAILAIASLSIGNTATADTDEAFPVSFLFQRCAENGEKEMYFKVNTNTPNYEIKVEDSAWMPSPGNVVVKRTDNASFTQYRLRFLIKFRPIASPDSVKQYWRTATFNIDALNCAPATTTESLPDTTVAPKTTVAPGTTVETAPTTTATATATMGATKIRICHATGSGRWVVITPSASGVYAGHSHHSGDIIPAFAFDRGKRSFHFGGKNLGPISVAGPTGKEILANGCRIPARPATVTTLTTQPAQTQPVPTAVPPTQPATSGPVPTPAPTAVPPTQPATSGPVPTPAPTAVPPTQPATSGPVPTPAPTAVPPTQPATSGPVPTPAPTAVPPTQPAGVPTTALFGPLTRPSLCPDGEFAHEGSCFPIPSLSVTNVVVPAVTGTDGGPLPVPIVECATREGGQVVTWFGYQLDAPDPLRVERGANNSMSPNGQPPTLFGPGIHLRVISAVSTDGVASWTIGATTVTSNSSTADCDTITDITTTPDTSQPDTSQPDTSQPDTSQPDTSQPDTSQPDTSQPDTSQPDTTQPREPGGCAVGEREDGGECISVDPVGLVLVDNYLECDGHGVARFAAFNTNGFALGGAGFSSSMSPQRLTGFAPQVIGDEPIASDDGRDLAEFVDVRYVTAVSWTVVHDGIETTISAGVGGARSNPTCPAARMESSGVHGGTAAPTSMAVTGSDIAGHLGIAILFVLAGALVVLIARRELDDHATT